MDNTTQKSKLADALQVDTWSEEERASFYMRSGQLVADSAIGRLLLSLTEEEAAQLELHVENHPELDDMLSYLSDTYPRFDDILTEELVAFQAEAEKILTKLTA